MKIKEITQVFSVRDLRNGFFSILTIVGGLVLTGLTIYGQQSGDMQLAIVAASASLVFVLLILIFVVPPLARNAGREASQMNLPFEFTTGGAIFLVLILIVGFSAWNTGNNLLFLVLSFLIAALVIGFLAGNISIKKLDIKMRFPESIYAGQPTPILVNITNRKRIFPTFSIVAEVRGKERERSVAANDIDGILPGWAARRLGQAPIIRRTLNHFVYIGRGQNQDALAEHIFPSRGRLMIKDFELTTKFPFGFFRHRRRLPAREAELIVFPSPTPESRDLLELAGHLGSRSVARRGAGQDLLSLREYRSQDDLRSIDWKATARAMQLTVSEYADEDESKITVIFDTRIAASERSSLTIRDKLAAEHAGRVVVESENFEKGVSIVAAVLLEITAANAEFRFSIDGAESEFGFGRGHLHAAMKRLAVVQPRFVDASISLEPDPRLEHMLFAPVNSQSILVSSHGNTAILPNGAERLKVVGF